ncbi:MAG: IclR family transcriptional regulator [Halobacteriales archaeon]
MIESAASREVQSVRTAFEIVAVLQDFDGATLPELAGNLDIAKSTIYNYLGTLQRMGYVVEREGTYRVGLRFLTHGMAAKSGLPLAERFAEALESPASRLSRPTWWVAEEQGRGIFVDVAAPGDERILYGRIGKRSYLHTHAIGKAMLAEMPPETVQAAADHHGLPGLTKETITSIEPLREELEDIRTRGYATSDGECALGVGAIGVAFTGPSESIHGIGTFNHGHDVGDREADAAAVLQDTVEEIRETTGVN